MIKVDSITFPEVQGVLETYFRTAPQVKTERWQGVDVSKNPAATSYELRNVCFEVDLAGVEDLDVHRKDIAPNLPWADDHFLERVGGEPLNPGVQWASWPWASSADKHRPDGRRFNHTYMERLWPKFARFTDDGRLPIQMATAGGKFSPRKYPKRGGASRGSLTGIGGGPYGDLQDLVRMLALEPGTRQAWIPLFFPEDTGYADGGRKPCTLGYQIMVRDGRAHIWYPLRSCDFVRHWADDCYLAVRLLLWVIDRCREVVPEVWSGIVPGTYAMHCTSLHIFENDRIKLLGG